MTYPLRQTRDKKSTMKKHLFLFLAAALLAQSCAEFSSNESFAADNGVSGSITRFAVYRNYLYALNANEVQTYRLQESGDPLLIHRLPTDYGLETIILYENTIYIGSRTALYILGIDNPEAPVLLSQTLRQAEFFGGCDPVVVKGNFAYSTIKIIQNICGFASAQSALIVYDISNKAVPVQVGIYPLQLPNGLGYSGDYLFVCDEGSDRVEVFDISNPRALKPTPYAIALEDPVDLIVKGGRMIVSAKRSFHFFDISDPANIRRAGVIGK